MSEPHEASTTDHVTGRRSVLLATGALAGAGALAACSSPPVPGSGSGGGGGNGGAASGGSGATPTSDVPVGGARFFPDSQTVVTQPQAGTFKAFDTTCPHAGCAVSAVEGDQLVCPCHQSHFALATGAVVSGPAPTGLTPKTVTVSGSSFTVS